MKHFLALLVFLSLDISATTYPRLSLEEFHQISDVNVIVRITKSEKSFNDSGDLCLFIGYGKIVQSFKGKIEPKLITFNLHSGMEVGDYYHLMLKNNSSQASYKTSANSMMMADEIEIKEKCFSAKRPEHSILMEGLGSTKIILNSSGNLRNSKILYHNNWVVPPESITVKIISTGWNGKTEVQYTELIKYLKSI